jgi:hypothetical protein
MLSSSESKQGNLDFSAKNGPKTSGGCTYKSFTAGSTLVLPVDLKFICDSSDLPQRHIWSDTPL